MVTEQEAMTEVIIQAAVEAMKAAVPAMAVVQAKITLGLKVSYQARTQTRQTHIEVAHI